MFDGPIFNLKSVHFKLELKIDDKRKLVLRDVPKWEESTARHLRFLENW